MCHSEAVDSEESAGAPEDEIEVTPAMIAAGVAAYRSSNEDYEEIELIVKNIFIEMKEIFSRAEADVPTNSSVSLEK
jgi:hypothetical protein